MSINYGYDKRFLENPNADLSIKYILSRSEQMICMQLAFMREQISRAVGRVDQKIGNQSGWDTDLQGIGGEFAAAKIYNVYPNMELKPDSGYDLIINDKKIDVKTTEYKTGKLLSKLNARLEEVDIFMLVVGRFPDFKLIGWTHAETLCREENIMDLGRGPGYVMNQRYLNKEEIK